MTSRLFTCAAVVCLVASAGCSTVPPLIPFFGRQSRIRDEGYSILYTLASEQSNVGKILIIKSASAKVSAEIKQIAEVFSQAKKQLDEFAKEDGSLNFKMSHLPAMEEKTRAAIASTTTKADASTSVGLCVASGRSIGGPGCEPEAQRVPDAIRQAMRAAPQRSGRPAGVALGWRQCMGPESASWASIHDGRARSGWKDGL